MRTILHIDLDASFVSVEQGRNPSLKGKPVIVGGDPEGRGVVAAASYEARAAGVRSGMPAAMARRLCPEAAFLRGDGYLYLRASERFFSIVRRYSPVVEAASVDEAYADLTGLQRLMGHPVEIAVRIRDETRATLGLESSLGLAANKLVAKVGSATAKPNGLAMVRPGYEAAFLAPQGLERLPGIGPGIRQKLTMFNIRRIGQLAALDPVLLEETFGRVGRLLHQRANGRDDRPVVSHRAPPPSVGREITFPEDTVDAPLLESVLYRLTEKAAGSLRREGLEARTVTLKLRYADFVTCSRSATLPSPTDLDPVLYEALLPLFRRLFVRRVAVRLIGVSLSRLVGGPRQLGLFEDRRLERLRRLYKGIDAVRERFGFHALTLGRSVARPPAGDTGAAA